MKRYSILVIVVLVALAAVFVSAKDSSRLLSQPNYISVGPYGPPPPTQLYQSPAYTTYYAGLGQVCGIITDNPRIAVTCDYPWPCEKVTTRIGFCGVKKNLRSWYSRYYIN